MVIVAAGMTHGQVLDLMGGRPGPVPMDIAQEAANLRSVGWSPDQIADVLGDKLQRRFNMQRMGLAAGAGAAGAAGAGTAGSQPIPPPP